MEKKRFGNNKQIGTSNMKKLCEIAEILSKSGYLQFKISSNINNKNKLITDIKFLPLGSIFLNKIHNELIHNNKGSINTYLIPSDNTNNFHHNSNEISSKTYLYIKSRKFHQNFLHIKENFQKEIPLAIKEELNYSNENEIENLINDYNSPITENNDNDIKINIKNGKLLTNTYFINEQSAKEYFYKIQRERKIWWMKLSSNPGRYYLTDLKTISMQQNSNLKSHSIKIKAKFENDNVLQLENIYMIPLKSLKLEKQNEFYLKDGRLNKRVLPAIIRTELQLETASIGKLKFYYRKKNLMIKY